MNDSEKAAFLSQLRAQVGATGSPLRARDPVNQAMIRHWCDAMEDSNPNYIDPDTAARSPHGQIVAPPAMLNAWTMIGHIPRALDPNDPQGVANHLLDSNGYIGVVATNCEHVYKRYLRLGDQLTGTQKLVDVSEEKQTALGIGHFVTTETQYHDQHGEHVGSMFFRILKFRPGTGRGSGSADRPVAERPRRPRPGMNQDTAFFWNGLREGELRIQQCGSCGALEHPPTVRCVQCGSTDKRYKVASGKGSLYSYVVAHHPQVPSFDYPLNIGLVELDEGIRLVTNVVACRPDDLAIGMPLEVCYAQTHDDVTLHQFCPARPAPRVSTLRYDDVNVGDRLPLCPVPITRTLIVATAIASRDYQDVHHDPAQAQRKGSKDIFMNILTSSGLSGRYISDWAGPDAQLVNLKIRLGAPNYPGDTMTMSGSVAAKADGIVQVAFAGNNSLGAHVTGTIDVALPAGK